MCRAITSDVSLLSDHSQGPPPEATIRQVWGRPQEPAFVTGGLDVFQVVQTQENHENTQREILTQGLKRARALQSEA